MKTLQARPGDLGADISCSVHGVAVAEHSATLSLAMATDQSLYGSSAVTWCEASARSWPSRSSHLVSDTKDAEKPIRALRRRRFGRSSSYFGRASFRVLYVKNLRGNGSPAWFDLLALPWRYNSNHWSHFMCMDTLMCWQMIRSLDLGSARMRIRTLD